MVGLGFPPGVRAVWADPEAEASRTLKLHMVRGSSQAGVGGAAGAADGTGGGAATDELVWCRLPEELVWEVVLSAPAAAHFRWQLVSRKWREVLTSAGFRDAVATRCRELRRRRVQQQPEEESGGTCGAVVCLTPGGCYHDVSKSKLKVVDVDLASFVPSWFWKSKTFNVEAVGGGLVCISDDNERHYWAQQPPQLRLQRTEREDREERRRFRNRYCVVNPAARWCKVLPPLPVELEPAGWDLWVPPAGAPTVSVFGYTSGSGKATGEVHLATCDLTDLAMGGQQQQDDAAGDWDLVACCKSLGPGTCFDAVQCAGRTYLHRLLNGKRVHVLEPRPGGRLLEVGALKEPSVAALGVDAASLDRHFCPQLVPHRGAVFLVKCLTRDKERPLGVDCDVAMGVWRLARERNVWELVARLGAEEAQRLTGVEWRREVLLVGAAGVRELVCCHVMVSGAYRKFMLGFNLNARRWELVHDQKDLLCRVFHRDDYLETSRRASLMVELRPDLFV